MFIAGRGLPVSPERRTRAAACPDSATLDAWSTRAATATTLADVFGE